MEPRHERIARIALAAGAQYGLALVGEYASRLTEWGAIPDMRHRFAQWRQALLADGSR
jgi:hypothetical protein